MAYQPLHEYDPYAAAAERAQAAQRRRRHKDQAFLRLMNGRGSKPPSPRMITNARHRPSSMQVPHHVDSALKPE